MKIDITFNFYSDSNGGDPDLKSPTLKKYHKCLWSKELPNGKMFLLSDKKLNSYLIHDSDLGYFSLGSDAITHSYRNQKRKQWLINQLDEEIKSQLFNAGSTIGSYLIFPNKKNNGLTINQSRGVNAFIDDRFDLTLECIRLFYLDINSPLYTTLERYKSFFDLFESFENYVEFFLLQDLIDTSGKIKFYLPFDNFSSKPGFSGVEDYMIYREGVLQFIHSRNERILKYNESYTSEKISQ